MNYNKMTNANSIVSTKPTVHSRQSTGPPLTKKTNKMATSNLNKALLVKEGKGKRWCARKAKQRQLIALSLQVPGAKSAPFVFDERPCKSISVPSPHDICHDFDKVAR